MTLPAVPGVRELWGRDVLHCPYCHGWELAAAVAINSDLITEDTRCTVEAGREGPFSAAAAERELCEQVLGDRRHGI